MKILRAGFDRTERQRKMAEKKLVALTFDDGPSVGTTDKVLDVLKENDIVASFFFNRTEDYGGVGLSGETCLRYGLHHGKSF